LDVKFNAVCRDLLVDNRMVNVKELFSNYLFSHIYNKIQYECSKANLLRVYLLGFGIIELVVVLEGFDQRYNQECGSYNDRRNANVPVLSSKLQGILYVLCIML
jgi:hypothetical protein